MTCLRTTDFEAALGFLEEANEVDGPEPFTPYLLDRLAALFGCQQMMFCELDRVSRGFRTVVGSNEGPPYARVEHLSKEDLGRLWATMDFTRRRNELVSRGRDWGEFDVMVWSDEATRRERGRDETRRTWGVIDAAAVYLTRSFTHTIAVFLNTETRDFGKRDRLLMRLLRPHLQAQYRNTATRRRLGAAIEALEAGSRRDEAGVILLGRRREIEYASPRARQLLAEWFRQDDGQLPAELTDWVATREEHRDRSPFTVARAGRQLVVAAADGGSALLLAEEPVLAVPLTAREWDVVRCVAAGMPNAEIATLLSVERSTVRKHLEHVYEKLGVRSRTAALSRLRPLLERELSF